MSRRRIHSALACALLLGCTTDAARDADFFCIANEDCRRGWWCVQARCVSAAPPPDQAILDAATDAAPQMDAAPPSMSDAAPPVMDATPPPPADATPQDATPPPPVDAAPPIDAAPSSDAAPPIDAAPPPDRDGDGAPDRMDNCPDVPNPDQIDLDGDGFGDACDLDDDDDTWTDLDEARCGSDPRDIDDVPGDADRDRVCDLLDADDSDGDGLIDAEDNCPEVANPRQADRDADGIGDRCGCLGNADCTVELNSYCAVNLECGGLLLTEPAAGRCVRGRCLNIAPGDDIPQGCGDERCVNDDDGTARCLPAMACMGGDLTDIDRDGLPDADDNCPDIYNPTQTDRDGLPGGDACRVECAGNGDCAHLFGPVRCAREELICGGFVIELRDAVCNAGRCEADEMPMECDPLEACGSTDGGPGCVPEMICEELACTPRSDGQLCLIEQPALELGRCVSGLCRRWTCLDPDCNENGPRYVRGAQLLLEERPFGFVDQRNQLEWHPITLDDRPAARTDIERAHAACADEGEGDAWRLPSIWELLTLETRILAEEQTLSELLGGRPHVQSRTVRLGPDGLERVSFALDTHEIRVGTTPAEIICVREADQSVLDPVARRIAFRPGGPVRDPWTGLTWTSRPALVNLAGSRTACDIVPQGRLPTVDELYGLMLWKGLAPPSLIASPLGVLLGQRVWTISTTPAGEALMLFQAGVVTLAANGATAGVLCVSGAPIPRDE